MKANKFFIMMLLGAMIVPSVSFCDNRPWYAVAAAAMAGVGYYAYNKIVSYWQQQEDNRLEQEKKAEYAASIKRFDEREALKKREEMAQEELRDEEIREYLEITSNAQYSQFKEFFIKNNFQTVDGEFTEDDLIKGRMPFPGAIQKIVEGYSSNPITSTQSAVNAVFAIITGKDGFFRRYNGVSRMWTYILDTIYGPNTIYETAENCEIYRKKDKFMRKIKEGAPIWERDKGFNEVENGLADGFSGKGCGK